MKYGRHLIAIDFTHFHRQSVTWSTLYDWLVSRISERLTSAAAAVDNSTPCRWIYRQRRSREEIERGDTDIIKYHGILAAAAYIDPRQRSVDSTLLELRKPTEQTDSYMCEETGLSDC